MPIQVIWEQLVDRGLEHLVLHTGAAVEADGLAVGILEGAAYRVRYHVACDSGWNVNEFAVESLIGHESVSLKRRGGDWFDQAGRRQQALSGATDVDIMVTPFTNTLPIRRLGLQVGQSARISVVYVRVPDLEVSRADQVYTSLQKQAEGSTVRYESVATGFSADLKLDADGLVTDYPGIFRLIWKESSA